MEKILNVSELIEKYDIPDFEQAVRIYEKLGIKVGVAVILTSDDAGSVSYTKGIRRFCANFNITFRDLRANTAQELTDLINELNDDDSVDGIMVMYPTMFSDNDAQFMNQINPAKDIEGLHNTYLGYLAQFEKFRDPNKLQKLVIPPTSKGILYIIKRYHSIYEKYKKANGHYPDYRYSNPFEIEGKRFTIINDSLAVGRSLALMLLNENGSVQICHKYTSYYDILRHASTSDFIISAVPSDDFVIPTEVVPENAIVIDISFSGNFEYPSIIEKCYKIAPRWDLVEKGNRINDITLYRLISNLFYLVNAKIDPEVLKTVC